METPSPSAIPTAASRAPVHIGAVGMMVRDLDRVIAYYRDMLGLTVQQTIDGLKKRLDAAGTTMDSIPGGFSATDPWGTSIRFTIAP
jgi:catechol 2,3-dioxygenase-like lactoylglutathione lyase family enzyme